MEAACTRRSKDNVVRLEKCLMDIKHRHSALYENLLDYNKSYKKLNYEQDRAYAERRYRDVARYEVAIRSVNIDYKRLENNLENIHKEIEKVKTELETARTALFSSSSQLKLKSTTKRTTNVS